MKQLILTSVISSILVAYASGRTAAEERAYRIVESDERFFHFGGGLADFQLSAKLRGTFDVVVEDNRRARITRFDVSLHDLLNTGSVDIGWLEGDQLADRLSHRPNALLGSLSKDNGEDSLHFSQTDAPEVTPLNSALRTSISIDHLTPQLAVFSLASGYVVSIGEEHILSPPSDVPFMLTTIPFVYRPFDEPIEEGGVTRLGEYVPAGPLLLVELVPEPDAAISFGVAVAVLWTFTRRPTSLHSPTEYARRKTQALVLS